MTLWTKLLCFLGIHEYRDSKYYRYNKDNKILFTYVYCKHCKNQLEINREVAE
jgi:hypothetical protein